MPLTDAFFVPSRARWSNLKDLKHEIVGANWLQQFFPEPVTEPIRLHVPAKRYLCAVDAQYWSGLSDGSKTSLVKQGGPMTEREVDEFELAPGHDAVVRLRRIDDRAKVVGLDVPPLSHYADAVLSVLTTPVQSLIRAYNPHFVRHRNTSVPFPVNTRRGPYRPVPVCEGDRWLL